MKPSSDFLLLMVANSKKLAVLAIIFSIVIIASMQNISYCAENQDQFASDIKALGIKHPASAYRTFIRPHLIISPHPDKTIDAFIKRAFDGEADSFALIAYYINIGYAGFYKSLTGKVALIRAMNDGSAQAPFWIAQSFLVENDQITDEEKIDNILSGLHWFGVSAGMGENKSHEYAMDLIDNLAKDNSKFRLDLMDLYNNGLEEAKQHKLSQKKH